MTTRIVTAATLRAIAFSLALVAPSTLVFAADATAPDASTNSAPAPATPAPPVTTTAPVAAPADTTTATTPADRPTTYTMQAGDSLDSIAKKFDTSIRALAKLNKITHAQYKKLRAGRVLQIPPASSDTSKAEAK
jgi:LysM repeat protein